MNWLSRSTPLLFHGRLPSAAGAANPSGELSGAIRRTNPRLRAGALVVLLALLWIALLGWAAQAPLGSPFEPAQRLRHDGNDFHVVMGAGVENGRRLAISAVGADHMALQAFALNEAIDAADFPVLRYRWQAFPRTLELSFVFRRSDDPDDVHTVTLPPAGAFPAYFDLANVPEWRGRIVEIGFAEFPTAQLVPADIAFSPFALAEAELWSPSWRGSLGALTTDWTAYRPWALMSVSALGPDAPWPHKPTPVIVLAVGLAASVLLAAAVLARSRRWIGLAFCVALAAAWIGLDLRWLGELADRHAMTRYLYAGKPWHERAAIEPDTGLLAGAARARALLARAPADTHVIVAAASVYDVLRLNYHLLPANVAPIGVLAQFESAADTMKPALLVVYADPSWAFDARLGTLQFADKRYSANMVFDEGDLRIFQLRGAVP